jgi:hypothetical protein
MYEHQRSQEWFADHQASIPLPLQGRLVSKRWFVIWDLRYAFALFVTAGREVFKHTVFPGSLLYPIVVLTRDCLVGGIL